MERKQIDLTNRPVEQKKSFLRSLCETLLPDRSIQFERLDCSASFSRETDPDMDLATFIDNITKKSNLRLQVGDPSPERIFGGVRDVYLPTCPNVERLAVFQIPYNESNYGIIDRLVQESFGFNIQSYRMS